MMKIINKKDNNITKEEAVKTSISVTLSLLLEYHHQDSTDSTGVWQSTHFFLKTVRKTDQRTLPNRSRPSHASMLFLAFLANCECQTTTTAWGSDAPPRSAQ